jgi:hypothetical protein
VRAPVLRKLTPLRATRLRDGTVALTARLSTSSQVHLYATVQPSRLILKRGSRLAVPLGSGTTRRAQALVLAAGGFPLQLRISGRGLAHRAVVRLQLSAVDPWGRRGASTLSFRVP